MHVAHLELSLQRTGAAEYTGDLRYTPAGSCAEAYLLRGTRPTIQIDFPALAASALDPRIYGYDLAAQLFAHPALRAGFLTARSHAEGAQAPLRLHLRLDADDPALHALRWETLADPEHGGFLALSERILLSRVPASSDLAPIPPRPRAALRALLAVASPHDLAAHGLAPIDTEGELARARTALADIPTTVLARGPTGGGVTLPQLAAALRDGPDILQLVAHGIWRRGQPALWLEGPDGRATLVPGAALVAQIAQLPRRPRLIVLVSCGSAGAEGQHVLAAIGPQLAAAGVAAVIAMQGAVRMDTMALLLPTLFGELRRDGQIDRALAAARAAVHAQPDWWMPALFLRVRDGLLWHPPAAPSYRPPAAPRTMRAAGYSQPGQAGVVRPTRTGTQLAAPAARTLLSGPPTDQSNWCHWPSHARDRCDCASVAQPRLATPPAPATITVGPRWRARARRACTCPLSSLVHMPR